MLVLVHNHLLEGDNFLVEAQAERVAADLVVQVEDLAAALTVGVAGLGHVLVVEVVLQAIHFGLVVVLLFLQLLLLARESLQNLI